MSQSEAAAAAASAEPETLKTSDGHGAGHLSAAFLTTEAGAQLAVLTAGGDGMVSNRQIRPSQNAKHQKVGKGVNAMDVNPARTLAVVSTENQVKVGDSDTLCRRAHCATVQRHADSYAISLVAIITSSSTGLKQQPHTCSTAPGSGSG